VFAELSDIVPFFEPNNIDWDPFKHGRPGEMVTYISFEGRILDVLADVLGPADEDAAE
jgi:hypothetical protein